MPGRVIDAAEIAKPFRDELKNSIETRNVHPLLVGFLANSDPAARKYASWTAKTCQETGIQFELREVSRTELEDKVLEANNDDKVHGILIYYPCFSPSMDVYLSNCVSPKKDVEGLCHLFRFNMYHNIRFLDEEKQNKCIIPCTPLAVIKILEYLHVYNSILEYGNRLHGRVVCVINRSEVVGRPLAAMLANDGATVYSVDVTGILLYSRGEGLKLNRYTISECPESTTLEQILPLCDVVVTGVPVKDYKVQTKWLKEGCVAINFSQYKNFEEDVTSRASIYVPAIGKVTVAMLERNLLRLHDYQLSDKSSK